VPLLALLAGWASAGQIAQRLAELDRERGADDMAAACRVLIRMINRNGRDVAVRSRRVLPTR
jgi:hypothetical protein